MVVEESSVPGKSGFQDFKRTLFNQVGFRVVSVVTTVLLALTLSGCGGKRAAGKEWSRVPHDEAVFGGRGKQEMNSVTAGGPGLVAVGHDDSGGDSNAAVWLSKDGRSWTRVPHDENVFGGDGDQEMLSVTAGGPGLVAVGHDDSGGDSDAAVWLSRDGRSWTRVSRDEKVFGGAGDQGMYSVTAGEPGLVAVGCDGCHPDDSDAAVWLSEDGRSWTRVPQDEKVFGGRGHQTMFSVTAGGPGLVAVGCEISDYGSDAAVWLSKDGRSWTRVPRGEVVEGGSDDQMVFAVTAEGPGLVAVGTNFWIDTDFNPAVWLSKDGSSWNEKVYSGSEHDRAMLSVTTGGPGLVAVGLDAVDLTSPVESDAAVWLSKDGRSWTRVRGTKTLFGGRGSQQMLSVTAGGPGLVAVGSDSSGGDSDAAVWLSPPGSKG